MEGVFNKNNLSSYHMGEWCGWVSGVAWVGGMVWYGVVWCGMVWYGVVWCGMVWYGVVWCGGMVNVAVWLWQCFFYSTYGELDSALVEWR